MIFAERRWRSAFYRHTWGDKDTWLLAAVATRGGELTRGGVTRGGELTGGVEASSRGSRVGWMVKHETFPPTAVWGHMQFAVADGAPPRLLYLNWQPHYAAGYIELSRRRRPSDAYSCASHHHHHNSHNSNNNSHNNRCCVFLDEHCHA